MSNQEDIVVDDDLDEIDFDAEVEDELTIQAMIESRMTFTLGEVAHALSQCYHPAFSRTMVTVIGLRDDQNNVFIGVASPPDDEKAEEFDYNRYAQLSYEEAVESIKECLEDHEDLEGGL